MDLQVLTNFAFAVAAERRNGRLGFQRQNRDVKTTDKIRLQQRRLGNEQENGVESLKK